MAQGSRVKGFRDWVPGCPYSKCWRAFLSLLSHSLSHWMGAILTVNGRLYSGLHATHLFSGPSKSRATLGTSCGAALDLTWDDEQSQESRLDTKEEVTQGRQSRASAFFLLLGKTAGPTV